MSGTIGAHSFRSVSISFKLAIKSVAELARIGRRLRGIDAARFHDHVRHEPVQALAVKRARGREPHIVDGLIVGLQGADADGGDDHRNEAQGRDERKYLRPDLHASPQKPASSAMIA